MYKYLIAVVLLSSSNSLFAQDNNTKNYIRPQNAYNQNQAPEENNNRWFFGGGLIANFSKYQSAFGISPLAGYALNPFVDVGLGMNLIYNYNNLYYNSTHSFNTGLRPFARAFPVPNIFAQLEYEQAWVFGRYKDNTQQKQTIQYGYNSLITSIGYAQRISGKTGVYMHVGIDLLNHKNAPYRDQQGNRTLIIGTGINF